MLYWVFPNIFIFLLYVWVNKRYFTLQTVNVFIFLGCYFAWKNLMLFLSYTKINKEKKPKDVYENIHT